MERWLVITEKPSVAKDIAAALGGFTEGDECLEREDYVITWAVGHLVELCEPQDYDPALRSWSLKLLPIVPDVFKIKPREGQKKRLDGIKKLAKGTSGIVNACDAGREGELVYRRIIEFIGLEDRPQRRLWLQSMTVESIREAFRQIVPASNYDLLGDAAWLRSVGDWLVGMNATRALTQRLRSRGETSSWSAGRVQTPTLAMLVERERAILAHRPRPYRMLRAQFSAGVPDHSWEGRFVDPAFSSGDRDEKSDRIFDLDRAATLAQGVAQQKSGVASEKRRRAKQNPPLPFDLTSLQREANRRSGLSAKRTLDAAQRLYEQHKLTTYPRTDSRHLPADYGATLLVVFEALAAGGLGELSAIAAGIVSTGPLNLAVVLDNTKVTDHFAIVPTGRLTQTELSGDDARVWELVLRQFLAAFLGPATWATVDREVQVDTVSGAALFRASSRTLENPGFLAALGQEASDDQRLPPLVQGNDAPVGVAAAILGVDVDDKVTVPPPRLNEAQLLRMMETAGAEAGESDLPDTVVGHGLGTPATRADIIERLVGGTDAYARRVEGRLMPTHKGMKLVDVLERVTAGGLTSPRLTGEWEYALRQVEKGERPRSEVLSGLAQYTREVAGRLRDFELKTLYAGSPSVGVCPACGSPVGENPWGYPCSLNTGEPGACTFMLWKDRFGRYVDGGLASRLLTDRKASDVMGLVDRSGRLLPAATLTLRLDESAGRWVVDVGLGGDAAETVPEVRVGDLCACPVHADCTIVETTTRFVCSKLLDGTEKVGPVLPRAVCAREMANEEVLPYFSAEGKSALLEGFISRRGRPFKGLLTRKVTGKHGFEFPERPPRPGRPGKAASAVEPKVTKAKRGAPKKATSLIRVEGGPKAVPAKKAGQTKKVASAKKAGAVKRVATKKAGTAVKVASAKKTAPKKKTASKKRVAAKTRSVVKPNAALSP